MEGTNTIQTPIYPSNKQQQQQQTTDQPTQQQPQQIVMYAAPRGPHSVITSCINCRNVKS